jgi:hypothetical protein
MDWTKKVRILIFNTWFLKDFKIELQSIFIRCNHVFVGSIIQNFKWTVPHYTLYKNEYLDSFTYFTFNSKKLALSY